MDMLMLLAFWEQIWELGLGIDFETKKGKPLQENMHMRIALLLMLVWKAWKAQKAW